MKIVIAPQALKGSLAAPRVAEGIAAGIRAALPQADIVVLPVADGGEGTVRALVMATGGELLTAAVAGPLGDPVIAEYGILGSGAGATERTAVIEMAAASGLPLVPLDRRDPLITSTYGTGELMRAALDAGCQRLIIGIGGSATNDGGAGMAQALGASLLDGRGRELPFGGGALSGLDRIVTDNLDPRLTSVRVQVACDVSNPLCGPTGASAIYGPQKGAGPAEIEELDAALARYAEVVRRDLGKDIADVPGAGAAGGLGAGLMAFAGAELTPGAQLVLDAVHLRTHAQGAAAIFTAEGQLDAQTAYGKTVSAVAAIGREAGAPVIALVGRMALSAGELDTLGIAAAVPLADGPMSLDQSMSRAYDLVVSASTRAIRLMLAGRALVTLLG
ncbi:MAG TPA: glycerate kinase [Ktedonobacterales bacterium]|nr:glycerate kinase [Ktedonobacterales bacterium]